MDGNLVPPPPQDVEQSSGLKRKADALEAFERATKKAVEKTEEDAVELCILHANGNLLKKVSSSLSWTGNDLKNVLQEYLEPSTLIVKFFCASGELEDSAPLAEAGLTNGVEVTAVIGARPKMHLTKPCSGTELAIRRNEWMCGSCPNGCGNGCFVAEGVQHGSIENVPEVAKQVAQELAIAFPEMETTEITLHTNFSLGGEVIVITNPGEDPKKACFEALGVRVDDAFDYALEDAEVDYVDLKARLDSGFNQDPAGDEFLGPPLPQPAGIIAATKVMAESLCQTFEFNFAEGNITSAPVIYGGYTSDGCIVGILSSRYCT
eukprot:gnl/MRDRNA2_/MRDRNA2_118047_c0_seq1.p1 gnl/MRDRNA2_/MRDRNA2_118047_c0~~gnl/MRDRNA2_/MRDRNA2_118047_c0_seq1.p1  ORF type:complete len:321 (+),score=66.66 gnl/MRDRNA2_/MRDRNA2_118047_c0_seq1:90-1052(+)